MIFYEEDARESNGSPNIYIARFQRAKPEDIYDGIVVTRRSRQSEFAVNIKYGVVYFHMGKQTANNTHNSKHAYIRHSYMLSPQLITTRELISPIV